VGIERWLGVLGENVRRLRAERQMTLDALAAASGVGRATLARLEAARANPTLETLYAIADAFEVPLGALLGTGDVAQVDVVRAGEAPRVIGALEAHLIGRLYGFGLTELLFVRFPAGRRRKAAAHPPGVVEHLLVTSGRLEAGPVGATVCVSAGDYLRFPGDLPHLYAAIDGAAEAVAAIGYPTPSMTAPRRDGERPGRAAV
jgi:transcriptional regulator with XRE-family HTH domain